MFVIETVIAGRFRTLNGGVGSRWASVMFCLFPAAFLLGFVHPFLWALATVCLEVYILRTLVQECGKRNAAIRNHRQEAIRLARAADAAAGINT